MSGKKQSSKRVIYEKQKELRDGLETTKGISIEHIASQIRTIGFGCARCGDCCVGEDNSVVVYPFEIRKIMAATGVGWVDAVEPPRIGEWDDKGIFHTLEWRIKKEGESCKFHSGAGCKIYRARPMLCETYPFYLNEGTVRCSECRGLGKKIGLEEAERIASLVKKRCITEIQEAIALIERYRDFERGSPTESGACIVHDSEGEHFIIRDVLNDNNKQCKKGLTIRD